MRNNPNNGTSQYVQVESHILEEMKNFMDMRKQYYDTRLDNLIATLTDRTRLLDYRFEHAEKEGVLKGLIFEEHFLTVEKAAILIRGQIDSRMEYAEQAADVQNKVANDHYDSLMVKFKESEARLQESTVLVKEKFWTVDAQTEKRFANVVMMSDLMLANINIRFTDVEKASTLYTSQLERRFDLLNTFTTQFTSELSKYPTRQEIEAKAAQGDAAIKTNGARLSAIELRIANYEGRIWAIGVGFTVLSLAIGVVLHFIK